MDTSTSTLSGGTLTLSVVVALLVTYSATFVETQVAQCDFNATDVIHRGAFTGEYIWNGRVKSVLGCARACVRRGLCMGFNFDPNVWGDRANGRGTCYLFGAYPNDRVRGRRWSEFTQYSYIANWTDSEIDPHCWSRPCPANAVCLPGPLLGGGGNAADCGFSCLNMTQVCPKPIATFTGPRTVGSIYTCNNGETSWCLQNTLWWNFTCPEWVVVLVQQIGAQPADIPDETLTFKYPHIPRGVNFREHDLFAAGVHVYNTQHVVFNARGKNDAHLLLQRDRYAYQNNTVEIVLGGCWNTKSVIKNVSRPSDDDVHYAEAKGAVLSKFIENRFWVSWAGGCVKVGHGRMVGDREMMQWCGLTHDINYMSASFGYGSAGSFQFLKTAIQLTYYCDFRPEQVDYTKHNLTYDGVDVLNSSSIVFKTIGRNNAHVLLHQDDENYDRNATEIVLGGWGDTLSVIWDKNNQSANVTHTENDIISPAEDSFFWISWADICVKVGKGYSVGKQQMMRWCGLNHEINYVSASYGFGSDGYFTFDRTILEIDECARAPCQNGATCHALQYSYTCECAPGWTGTECQTDIDECASAPCQNGATCDNLQNSYTCQCVPGWTGTNCQTDVDECASASCQNGATCYNLQNNYACRCAPGWTGTNCTTDIDECASVPCHNGATCNNLQNNYTCRCASGWTGTNCQTDVDECASTPCHNGATCYNLQNSYACQCALGWTGTNCTTDIDECASVPCHNGATCNNLQNNYTCQCAPGWTETNCQTDIDECANAPCQNGATCYNLQNSYACRCAPGWTGSNCTTDIDECASVPCYNGATCNNLQNNYTCQCALGWTGTNCQTDLVRDCNDVSGASGVYTLTSVQQIYCDMDTDEGNWLVFQRRKDGSVDFERFWSDYRVGFGSLEGEFWLGLEPLRRIVGNGEYELRIDLGDWDGIKKFAKYTSFSISDESDNYRLAVSGYSGDGAGDAVAGMNGQMFSTIDVDNDGAAHSCAERYRGGWWYNACHAANLNGLYHVGGNTTMFAETVVWANWRGYFYSLKTTEMKIRRK